MSRLAGGDAESQLKQSYRAEILYAVVFLCRSSSFTNFSKILISLSIFIPLPLLSLTASKIVVSETFCSRAGAISIRFPLVVTEIVCAPVWRRHATGSVICPLLVIFCIFSIVCISRFLTSLLYYLPFSKSSSYPPRHLRLRPLPCFHHRQLITEYCYL